MTSNDGADEQYMLPGRHGREYGVNRDNSVLYTFFGAASMYDHVYVQHAEPDGTVTSLMIFKELTVDKYERLKAHFQKHDFRQILNAPRVDESDIIAFDSCVRQLIDIELKELFGE